MNAPAGADIRCATDAVLFYRKNGRSIMAGVGDATRFIAPPSAFYAPAAFTAAGDGDDVIVDPDTLRPDLLAYRRSHRLTELVAHASAARCDTLEAEVGALRRRLAWRVARAWPFGRRSE